MWYNAEVVNLIKKDRSDACNILRPDTRKDWFLMQSQFTPSQSAQENIEEWRDVPGYEGCYQVSSFGRVRSLDRTDNKGARRSGRILRPGIDLGYYFVHLSKDGNKQVRRVHALVAAAFLGERPEGYSVNHIDAVRTHNHVGNLEYVTHGDNIRHAANLGRMGKLTPEQVLSIRKSYSADRTIPYSVFAKKFNVSTYTIAGVVKARTRTTVGTLDGGVARPIRRYALEGVDVYGLYNSGLSLNAIARQFNANVSSVSRAFHKEQKRIEGISEPLTTKRP